MKQQFLKEREKIRIYGTRFFQIFGCNITNFYGSNAIDIALGFDIVRFSDYLANKHGLGPSWSNFDSEFSLGEWIHLEYGAEAKALLDSIIR